MLTYQYQCQKCKKIIEVFQSIKAKPLKLHRCGGKLIRLIGAGSGIIFKGDAWAKDGYKGKEKK